MEKANPDPSRSARNIVIIDDDRLVRTTLADMLSDVGYETLTAGDGIEGVELCRRHRVDLVITDIVMPRCDGIETILAIRSEFPETRILAMSSRDLGHGDYLEHARKIGANRTLRKPFRMNEFLDAVQTCLDE
jgi:DNA-binding response OmpR family regulator